jgi:hypothetical protein
VVGYNNSHSFKKGPTGTLKLVIYPLNYGNYNAMDDEDGENDPNSIMEAMFGSAESKTKEKGSNFQ